MSLLPERSRTTGAGLSRRYERQAIDATGSAELELFKHSLSFRLTSEKDRLDSEAMGDALRHALTEEVDLLEFGLRLAGDDPLKVAMVARKLDLFADTNNRRIRRRFGA